MSELDTKKTFREYMENYAPRQLDRLFEKLDDGDGIMLETCFSQFAALVANEATKQESGLPLQCVSGSYSYEIDFGAHCRAGIDITNNEPKVIGAMNGWGDGISLADIKIKKL